MNIDQDSNYNQSDRAFRQHEQRAMAATLPGHKTKKQSASDAMAVFATILNFASAASRFHGTPVRKCVSFNSATLQYPITATLSSRLSKTGHIE